MVENALKPVLWVGSSKADLKKFPAAVQDQVGFALYQAQVGLKPRDAKQLKGHRDPTSWKSSHDTKGMPTGRCTRSGSRRQSMSCTAFQKKSKRGIETPKQELDLVQRRLKAAQRHHDNADDER